MEVDVIINKIAQNPVVKSHLINVLNAFQALDYHALNDLLEDGCYFQDMTKTAFIYKQQQIFSYLDKQGDSTLLLSTNLCNGCLCNEPIFVLTGDQSGLKYAIYIKFLNDEIVDIYRCQEHSDAFGNNFI
tara:strand:+ start:22047 stop:22436 length:390 start_codon:yes stop_codon:yes gene_type:complete